MYLSHHLILVVLAYQTISPTISTLGGPALCYYYYYYWLSVSCWMNAIVILYHITTCCRATYIDSQWSTRYAKQTPDFMGSPVWDHASSTIATNPVTSDINSLSWTDSMWQSVRINKSTYRYLHTVPQSTGAKKPLGNGGLPYKPLGQTGARSHELVCGWFPSDMTQATAVRHKSSATCFLHFYAQHGHYNIGPMEIR